MNDADLISRLKAVRPPERPAEYWDNFPSDVRVQLRPAVNVRQTESRPFSRLSWAGGMALACMVLALSVWPAHVMLKNERVLRRELAQFPRHLQTFMADEHGLHYLIAEKE